MRRLNLMTRQRGFNLIEVITVIVMLSLLAVMGSKFILESTKSYTATQTRARLVNTGRQALERMSRQLRIALPYSVRLTNSNTCLEFMPIASGGNYTNDVPDNLNNAAASSSINPVSTHTIDFGTAFYVTISAMQSTDIYGSGPASMAGLGSRTNTSLTLSAPKKWQRNSINKRFYLLDKPQAFCVVGTQLRFYDAQDPTAASVDLTSAYSIMADNVSSPTPFSLSAGSENRNTNVLFNLTFVSGAESVSFNQAVMIRNVP